jgi:GR25 family glycosyltransferase involved in LPS biosynthesis
MRLFDRFDKVYCINLDKRTDRLEKFQRQVVKYDLGDYTRISAIDGTNLNINEYTNRLSPGELGLVLTNLEIIKDAKKNQYNNILILEDDCEITDEILNIEDYFGKLPSNWDMLYMGGNHNTHMGVQGPIVVNDKIVKLHSTYSTHLIGIKNTLFDHIENIISKYQEPLDVSYVKLQKIFNVYSFYPAIASQIVDFSDIQNKITDYRWLIK